MVKALILGSGHHVHLRQEDFETLFGQGASMEKKRQLGDDPQGGFLAKQQVNVICPKGQFQASILGPARPYTQVEISLTDAHALGVSPAMSNSGDLEGTSPCVLVGPMGQLELARGLMIVRRHLHINKEDMETLGCRLGDMVRVRIDGPRALIFEQVVAVKQFDGMASVMHIDYDEMNAAGIKNTEKPYGEVTFCHDEAVS